MRPSTLTIQRNVSRSVARRDTQIRTGHVTGHATRRAARALARAAPLILVWGLVAPTPSAGAMVGAGGRIDEGSPGVVVGAGVAPSSALAPGAGTGVVRRAGLGGTGDARAAPGAGPVVGTSWSSPVPGEPVVTRPFEAPAETWAAGHRGVDLTAWVDAAVLAPADGVVTFAGTVVDRDVLTITHPDGLRSSLEPVTTTVAVGTRVGRGAVVGAVQDVPTHCTPGVCLHWGVRDGATYLDPMHLLTGGPIVLLPWDEGAG